MNIVELEVDGFGVWSGLRLESLSGGLNVLYGPNEAGKTTLLEFVRSVLYGFADERRRRYLPPLRGGRPGGSLKLTGPGGACHVRRHADEARDPVEGNLQLLAADGTLQTGRVLDLLLGDVDEATFNNVFAVGLKEIQELAALDDTSAAQLLYRLTSGLDRVSLADVLGELAASRESTFGGLAADGRSCRVTALLAERERILADVDQLRGVSHRYAALAHEQNELEAAIAQREAQCAELEQSARVIEAAVAVREPWRERAALETEIAALAARPGLDADAARRFELITARLAARRRRIAKIERARKALRNDERQLGYDRAMARHAPRIEALAEQENWITTLEIQVRQLEQQLAQLEEQAAAQQARLGLGAGEGATGQPLRGPFKLDQRSMAALRSAGRTAREPRRRLREARSQMDQAAETAQTLAAEIRSALSGRPEKDLAKALERAGGLVTQLRRRVQLDDRLAQMGRHQVELETQSRHLLDRQLLPSWVLAALGGLFVFGVVLILAGLFLPTSVVGSAGWALAVLGLGGTATAAGAKWMLERAAGNQLEACQKQAGILALQIKQAKEEREGLDAQLPRGGGPMLARLQAAEKDLSALEDLLSLDGRRQMAQQEADAARAAVRQARDDCRSARRRWKQALGAAGLPDELSYAQLRRLSKGWRQFSDLAGRIERHRAELDQRRRELESLMARLNQVMADVGIGAHGEAAADQLRQLRQALTEHQATATRRLALVKRARRLRRHQRKLTQGLHLWQRRRKELLRQAGATDEQELRELARQLAQGQSLRERHGALSRQIAAALTNRATEDDVQARLADPAAGELEAAWDEATGRWRSMRQQLQELFEARGRLAHELEALAADRRLSNRLVDLGVVEAQLREAIERWQVLAVTQLILESIKRFYEADRQPETLRQASEYLARLTEGRYTRVWTPLGESGLRVDDAEGSCLGAESLSRGTREQLFLCLRLALAASYARRGVELPLVLDDVLVNFDGRRAKAAAALLRAFAAEGRQVFVFTCHEHVLKLFKSLKVPARRLPANDCADAPTVTWQQPAAADEPNKQPARPAAEWMSANGSGMIEIDDDRFEVQIAGDPADEEELEEEAASEEYDEEYDGDLDREDGEEEDDDAESAESDADEPEEASHRPPAHKVIVVRGRRGNDPFANAIWHDPVEDESDEDAGESELEEPSEPFDDADEYSWPAGADQEDADEADDSQLDFEDQEDDEAA
ncbi:MAG: AAA family ATPase [Pirellulales bacterium]